MKDIILEYIYWLEDFCLQNETFSDNWYKYNNYENEKDIESIKNLKCFFRTLETYAEENNISPEEFQGEFIAKKDYYLKHNGKTYKIGYISEQGTDYSATLVDENKDVETISSEDLINSSKNTKIRTLNRR